MILSARVFFFFLCACELCVVYAFCVCNSARTYRKDWWKAAALLHTWCRENTPEDARNVMGTRKHGGWWVNNDGNGDYLLYFGSVSRAWERNNFGVNRARGKATVRVVVKTLLFGPCNNDDRGWASWHQSVSFCGRWWSFVFCSSLFVLMGSRWRWWWLEKKWVDCWGKQAKNLLTGVLFWALSCVFRLFVFRSLEKIEGERGREQGETRGEGEKGRDWGRGEEREFCEVRCCLTAPVVKNVFAFVNYIRERDSSV